MISSKTPVRNIPVSSYILTKTQLEDLYVSPEDRGKGLGKRLFGELGSIARERGCQRVEWRVLKVSLKFDFSSGKLAQAVPFSRLMISTVEQTFHRLLYGMSQG